MSKTTTLTDEWRFHLADTLRRKFDGVAPCPLHLADWMPCTRSYAYRLIDEGLAQGYLVLGPRHTKARSNSRGSISLAQAQE